MLIRDLFPTYNIFSAHVCLQLKLEKLLNLWDTCDMVPFPDL